MPVFDPTKTFVGVLDQEMVLPGSLVLVRFELKHYAIRNRNTRGVSGNTFTATVSAVEILERASPRLSSPYKSLLLKGPSPLPQAVSKRRDQERAVLAFHPGTV